MLKAFKVDITQKNLKQVNCASLFVELCKQLNNNTNTTTTTTNNNNNNNNNNLASHFGKGFQPIA